MNIKKIIKEEVGDFDWIKDISNNPLEWVEPEVNLSNVERDEDDWPLEFGVGHGEIWLDVSKYTSEQKREILDNVENFIGELYFDNDRGYCFKDKIKAYLIHCGHEENHFFSQKNHICCMTQSYDEFIESERVEMGIDGIERPQIDGGLYLNNSNINESEEDPFNWIKEIKPSANVTSDNIYVGMKVKINTNPEDYKNSYDVQYYLDQSGGGTGVVTSIVYGWARVKWENEHENDYQIGWQNTYALTMVF